MNKTHRGFTVLELLIVIAIMCILIGLILVGLNSARSHSRDEDKVTNVQTITVGLTQFYDACRTYPADLDAANPANAATCANLGSKTIVDFIPDLASYQFNQSGSDYVYAGLTTNASDASDCTNFHIGVKLEGSASGEFPSKAGFAPSNYPYGMQPCAAHVGAPGATDFDGTDDHFFDIKK